MKVTKHVMLLALILVMQSCIVKSIQPFYTSDVISFDASLLGNFTDNKNGSWEILSFKEAFEKDNNDAKKYSKQDIEALKKYNQAYVVNQNKNGKEATFLAVPFKVENHVFIDFTPIAYDDSDSNALALQHLLKTHSVAKLNKQKDGVIELQWLDEKPIEELLSKEQLKLKHERVGVDETLVLTASSQELYQFLVKFVKSDLENKWSDSETYKLAPVDL